jgi:hypothetical protein
VNGGEYIRVYLGIPDDPRFATIYGDDHRLATWLRLLMGADAVWPSTPAIPRSVGEDALAALVDAGLVELLPHDHYRIHGLDAERERRSAQGRAGGLASGASRRGSTGAERPSNERSTVGELAEQSKAEQSKAAHAPRATPEDHDAEALFAWLLQRKVTVNVLNGHADMLRKAVAKLGLEAALRLLEAVPDLVDARQAAFVLDNASAPVRALREPPRRVINSVDRDPHLRELRAAILAKGAAEPPGPTPTIEGNTPR